MTKLMTKPEAFATKLLSNCVAQMWPYRRVRSRSPHTHDGGGGWEERKEMEGNVVLRGEGMFLVLENACGGV